MDRHYRLRASAKKGQGRAPEGTGSLSGGAEGQEGEGVFSPRGSQGIIAQRLVRFRGGRIDSSLRSE